MTPDPTTLDQPRPKCYFTQASLPTFVNLEQPSTKKPPFPTVLKQSYSHTFDIVIPEDGAKRLEQALAGGKGTLRYARVYMKLGELIDGEFFNHYIKSGNIIMLSEGRPGIDQVFSLLDGVLKLEVDKPTYERMGLAGKPIPSGGRKHAKMRYAIEANLRLPSMVHGKPGFERIVWAFKNVLNRSVSWLFYDLRSSTDGRGPLATFQPKVFDVEGDVAEVHDVLVPHFPEIIGAGDDLESLELLEWLSLICLGSPRVQQGDKIDPYLCRWRTPLLAGSDSHDSPYDLQNLRRFRWRGLVPARFIMKALLASFKASADDWFAITATSFSGETYTILKTNGRTLTWEYVV